MSEESLKEFCEFLLNPDDYEVEYECPVCGYIDFEEGLCPNCGKTWNERKLIKK